MISPGLFGPDERSPQALKVNATIHQSEANVSLHSPADLSMMSHLHLPAVSPVSVCVCVYTCVRVYGCILVM